MNTSRRTSMKRKTLYVSSDEEEEVKKVTPPKKKALPTPRPSIKSESATPKEPMAKKVATSTSKTKPNGTSRITKRKVEESDEYEEESEVEEPVKKPPAKPKATPTKDKAKADVVKVEDDAKGKGKAKATPKILAPDELVQNMTKSQIEAEMKDLEGLREDLALKVCFDALLVVLDS